MRQVEPELRYALDVGPQRDRIDLMSRRRREIEVLVAPALESRRHPRPLVRLRIAEIAREGPPFETRFSLLMRFMSWSRINRPVLA